MVSVNPNPVEGHVSYVDCSGTPLPGGPVVVSDDYTAEELSKKVRKPYTITKCREIWTEQEHDKFLEALQLFDRDWKKIEVFVGSKTVIQIRSHAQKYFLKVQKSGSNERLPPPRPKRKATHPYPHKASKIAHLINQGTSQPSVQYKGCAPAVLEPAFVHHADLSSVHADQNGCVPISSWTNGINSLDMKRDDAALALQMMDPNCCSSSNESASTFPNVGYNYQSSQDKHMKAMPNFAKVYRFIGSVFDPNMSDHLQRMKRMDPIDVETALCLMKNLSTNLMSPEFEEHRKLLSSYDVDSGKVKCSPRIDALDNSNTAIPAT